jgi:hypothetical protein
MHHIKYSFLYKIRDLVVKINPLKTFLKENQLFNLFYNRFLVGKPSLSSSERLLVADYVKSDVNKLKKLLGVENLL